MARTYAAVEIDPELRPKGWRLVRQSLRCSDDAHLIKKLRENGFYANFGSLEELDEYCKDLSEVAKAQKPQAHRLDESSKGSSSKMQKLRSEHHSQLEESAGKNHGAMTREKLSSDTKAEDKARCLSERPNIRVLPMSKSVTRAQSQESLSTESVAQCGSLPRYTVVQNWSIESREGVFIPITDVPYDGMEKSSATSLQDLWLSGQIHADLKKLKMKIVEWKLDLDAAGKLAVHVKTTDKVWLVLRKPKMGYKQTIRAVMVCCQIFSILKESSEMSKHTLLQQLENEFYDWYPKPNELDLHQSIALMEELNLQSMFGLDSRLWKLFEAQCGGDSDADSDSKPVSFKRSRRPIQRDAHEREDLGGAHSDGQHVDDLDSDKEPLILKRAKKVPEVNKGISGDHDVLSHQLTKDIDDVTLSSRLTALKRRRLISDKNGASNGSSDDRGVLGNDEPRTRKNGLMENISVSPHAEGAQNVQGSFQAGGCEGETDITSRIQKIIATASSDVYSCDDVGKKHVYSTGPFPLISKLWAATFAARQALACLESGGSLENAENICSKRVLKEFIDDEVVLRGYGVSQFFPTEGKQKEVAERVNYYAHDGDMVVEFCSQEIDYFSLLKERLASSGKKCDYKRYLVNSSEPDKGWLSLDKKTFPTGSKLLICMSFSLTLRGDQINNIIDHTLELKPKLIVLIAPLFNHRLQGGTSYNLVWEDSEILQSEVTWPWGMMEVSSTLLDKRKGASPTVYLWSRTDWTTKHRQIASRFGHLLKSVNRTK